MFKNDMNPYIFSLTSIFITYFLISKKNIKKLKYENKKYLKEVKNKNDLLESKKKLKKINTHKKNLNNNELDEIITDLIIEFEDTDSKDIIFIEDKKKIKSFNFLDFLLRS